MKTFKLFLVAAVICYSLNACKKSYTIGGSTFNIVTGSSVPTGAFASPVFDYPHTDPGGGAAHSYGFSSMGSSRHWQPGSLHAR